MRATKRKRESAAAAAPRKVAAGVMAGKPPAAKKQGPTVVLAGNCSVKDAAALKESLCAKFDESAAVTVDVRELERVDTATIQLLCAFVRDRAAQDRQVVWMGESRPLQDAARLLGVGELLALPRVAESNGSGVTA